MRIMTNNPKKIVGIEGYGLTVVEEVPIQHAPKPHNERYLLAKRRRLGHPCTTRGCRSTRRCSTPSTSTTATPAEPSGRRSVTDPFPPEEPPPAGGSLIKGTEGQDDFAALAEVISRRFARMRDVADEEYDESFSSTPNLVLVDGGKGQLSAVLAAMQAYDLPRVAVISLAKRAEEVFVPDRPEPIVLDRHSPGLQLLQRVRDEAHRFALGFHRQRRDTKAKESIFDTLPGVGPARRRALLQHFGSAERFLAASQEELEGVPGMPAKTARSIYAQLHKAGRA